MGDVSLLLMFFYGTLKRGQRNHDRYCSGALRVEEATVRGELYDLPFGYPALVVPEESIHAVGTGDPTRDVEEQRRSGREQAPSLGGPRVLGELFAFDDPDSRLPPLDRLEGFDPADASSPYRRVLVPVETKGGSVTLAWAYAIKEPSGAYLSGGSWPP